MFILCSAFSKLSLFLSGDFSGEEGGRAGKWDSDERWSQVQAEAGEHTTSSQVQKAVLSKMDLRFILVGCGASFFLQITNLIIRHNVYNVAFQKVTVCIDAVLNLMWLVHGVRVNELEEQLKDQETRSDQNLQEGLRRHREAYGKMERDKNTQTELLNNRWDTYTHVYRWTQGKEFLFSVWED